MKLFTPRFIKDLVLIFIFGISFYALTHNPFFYPRPYPTTGNWSIQFMQHPLLLGFAGHNYLLLRDADGSIVSELHGLATDKKTGNWKYVGADKTDVLQVWEFEESTKYLAGKNFPGIILSQGNQLAIETLWKKAEECKDRINQKQIPYPPYGFTIRGETENSNSVAYTLALCMQVDVRHLGLFTPGSQNNLLK